MKKFLYVAAAFLAAVSFASCDDENKTDNEKEQTTVDNAHLDLWVSVTGTGTTGTYVARVDDPTNANQTVDVTGKGAEVTGKLTKGALQKGGYYYFATEGNDGIAKYQITNKEVKLIGECPYGKNVFKKGGMTGSISATHAWIGDNVLLLSQYSTTTKKTIWAKFDVQNMKLLSEGEFNLHDYYPSINGEEVVKFSTSGHMRYRASDGKILFFTSIHFKGEGKHPMTGAPNTVRGPLAVVVIDEKTMAIEKTLTDDRVSGLALEAYGDTQQEKAYFDENGDLYLICLKKGSTYSPGGPIPECVLIRVKSGANDTDRSFLFTPTKDTDILVVRSLSAGKALVFAGDHERYYNGSKGNYDNYVFDSYYYAIFDSNAKTLTRLKMDGTDLPWTTGGFNNYIARVGDTYYIGVNAVTGTDTEQIRIYALDAKTEKVTSSFGVDAGLELQRIFSVDNVEK